MPRITIPTQVKVRVGIEQGCVYNFAPDKATANHYFIVLNKNPKNDADIYLASFTSKKENVLRFIELHKLDRKTFVEVERGDCTFLSRPDETCINCNKYRRYDIQKMIDLIDASNGNCNYPKVSNKLLERVLYGVKSSRLVAEDVKKLCGI